MRLGRNTVPALAAAAAALVALAGCGRQQQADLVKGKTLFVQKCGSCHTLARAGTKGVQGPDLDDAFAQSRRDGFGSGTIRGVVRDQITDPNKAGIMPANLVTGNDRFDVASYVAAVAAKPGKDTGALASAGQPKTSNKTATEKKGTLTIPADPTGALAFQYGKATATAGRVSFDMPNKASIGHDIAVKDKSGKVLGKGPVVSGGGTSKFSTTLKSGSYEFFCTVPGHEAGGMKGTLTVK